MAARLPFSASEKRALSTKPIVDLLGASLPAFALYAWCRNSPLETMIPGVLQGPAFSVRALIAANYNRPAEETDAALTELVQRGLVIVDETGVAPAIYVPSKLAELCSAPTTRNQIPGWVAQIKRLGALRERVRADALDVTARADALRSPRREDGARSLFDRLKEALGIALHPLPSTASQQCAFSFGSEVRIVEEQLDPLAECWLAVIDERVPDGKGESNKAGDRGPVGANAGHPADVLRQISAGENRATIHPPAIGNGGVLPEGRRRQAGNELPRIEGVPRVLREEDDGESAALERFIAGSRDADGPRILIAADKPNERELQMFAAAIERTGATPADLDRMAPLAQAIFPWQERGIALDWLCKPFGWTNRTDRFQELLVKSRTPVRRAQPAAQNEQRMNPASRSILQAIEERRAKERRND